MATNDFLPFGTGSGANVLSQADYAALTARLSGFQSGVAKSVELNKVWRQASVIAAMIAQFTVDRSGQDVLDDGDLVALQAKFQSALIAAVPGRLLRTTVYSRTSGGVQQVSVNGGTPTTTGASTFTSLPNAAFVEVEGCGGGGGGGGAQGTTATTASAGGGGGAGGYFRSRIAGPLSSVSVTVGTAGAGAPAGLATGSNGGTTSFGTYGSATGGAGSPAGSLTSNPIITSGGVGGVGSGGNILNAAGSVGNWGLVVVDGTGNSYSIASGQGGTSTFGGGGQSVSSNNGLAAQSLGAGGSGGSCLPNRSSGSAGGAGGPGIVIVREYA